MDARKKLQRKLFGGKVGLREAQRAERIVTRTYQKPDNPYLYIHTFCPSYSPDCKSLIYGLLRRTTTRTEVF
ncbi:hypothetical protein ACHAWO_003480 [Cyclotella atomus]|uniref:Uncharacterized protein n=1 Tax=Cyclotella atomus TaxID=382360 RepID=A0ABD3NLT5_9STRA